MPETISKFLPANVINSGTALLTASQYNVLLPQVFLQYGVVLVFVDQDCL